MVGIYVTVNEIYKENTKITFSELRDKFPNYKASTLKSALSTARRYSKDLSNKSTIITQITEEEIERIIIEKLNKTYDNANIRLAIDFLKIKQADSGLDNDLDIEQFIKMVQRD